MAQEKKLKIVYINDRTLRKDKDITYVEAPSPDVFLSLFANANMIVTNSFHGTVFSIIFQKEFFVELENRKQRNIRVENLLKELQIMGRDIDSNDYSDFSFPEICWDRISCILQKKRKEASDYFDKVLIKM